MDMEELSEKLGQSTISNNAPISSDYRKNRCCAFCLNDIPESEVKLCGGCKRRAYCSKNCQLDDWSPKLISKSGASGQGHKNWCGLEYGEEGIDWIVTPVPGKGLGVVALRDIKDMSKVMVESCQLSPDSHPGISNLTPIDGDLFQKFYINAVDAASDEKEVKNVVCLKLSRVNHSCSANSTYFASHDFGVVILYSNREIKKGEEITISYIIINEYKSTKPSRHPFLKLKWGIVCPEDSLCNSPAFATSFLKAQKIHKKLEKISCGVFCPKCVKSREVLCQSCIHESINYLKEFIKLGVELNCSWRNRKNILIDGFDVALMDETKKLSPFAKSCLDECIRITEGVDHPNSKSNLELRKVLKDLPSNPNYSASII